MPDYGLEQQRRDFMSEEPELFAYIRAVERSRMLESAAQTADGAQTASGAAARLWLRAAQAGRHAEAMIRPLVRVIELPDGPTPGARRSP